MNKKWNTQKKDLSTAELIMQDYAIERNTERLGLFEMVVDQKEKRVNFRLSEWILTLEAYFKSLYGEEQGDFVTRKVVSRCITQGYALH